MHITLTTHKLFIHLYMLLIKYCFGRTQLLANIFSTVPVEPKIQFHGNVVTIWVEHLTGRSQYYIKLDISHSNGSEYPLPPRKKKSTITQNQISKTPHLWVHPPLSFPTTHLAHARQR